LVADGSREVAGDPLAVLVGVVAEPGALHRLVGGMEDRQRGDAEDRTVDRLADQVQEPLDRPALESQLRDRGVFAGRDHDRRLDVVDLSSEVGPTVLAFGRRRLAVRAVVALREAFDGVV